MFPFLWCLILESLETDKEMESCPAEGLPGSALKIQGGEESKTGQRGKLTRYVVATETSDNPVGSSKAGWPVRLASHSEKRPSFLTLLAASCGPYIVLQEGMHSSCEQAIPCG